MQVQPHIRNILFDLGGVILDINVGATLEKFFSLDFPAELLQYPNNMTTDLFYRYETGRIGTGEFRDEIRRLSGVNVSDEELDEAWNAMIVGIPEDRTRLIRSLRERYDLFMLSNTSPLHAPLFEKMYLDSSGESMHAAFRKIFYSFEIGCHKPDHEAWQHVIGDTGIVPAETLFIDDNIHNIKASQELGFKAIHLHERLTLTDLGFDL